MNHSESISELIPALIAAKNQFQPAVKDSENPHFHSKFVSLGAVLDAVEPALLANGLLVLQPTRIVDGRTVLVTTLFHSSGEWLASEYPVTAAQNGPQGEGSALTYAKRYALMALLAIAAEDDDAEAASRPAPPARAARRVSEPTSFNAAIDAAATTEQLSKVGTQISAAEMDPADRAKLRAQFTERMQTLKATA